METLKISDLSVGDWVGVRCGTKINAFKVEEIRFNNIIHKYVALLNNKAYGLPTTELHPIPITAEILEQNGFERGRRGNFYHHLRLDKSRTLYIHASTNGWRVEITYDTAGILRTTHLMPDMNSVHELQHALRLAGVDKEINL